MPADETSFEVLLRSEQTDDELAQVRVTVPGGWAGRPGSRSWAPAPPER
jgi:hypothetical protein